ncbi:MAG: hypothetical protein ABSB96_11165 [Gaiellaceae bacterium]
MDELEETLARIRKSLLRGIGGKLGPDQGEAAFERHILLAVRFHNAAGLNQTVTGEGKGWCEYFEEHFPKRSEWRPEDAKLLWNNWRVGLLKWEAPKRGVTVTHGQPEAHWYREPDGTLCIDLESMWDEFAVSVTNFLNLLRRDEGRRTEALRRWSERSWCVRQLVIPATHPLRNLGVSTSSALSATASQAAVSSVSSCSARRSRSS